MDFIFTRKEKLDCIVINLKDAKDISDESPSNFVATTVRSGHYLGLKSFKITLKSLNSLQFRCIVSILQFAEEKPHLIRGIVIRSLHGVPIDPFTTISAYPPINVCSLLLPFTKGYSNTFSCNQFTCGDHLELEGIAPIDRSSSFAVEMIRSLAPPPYLTTTRPFRVQSLCYHNHST